MSQVPAGTQILPPVPVIAVRPPEVPEAAEAVLEAAPVIEAAPEAAAAIPEAAVGRGQPLERRKGILV